MAQSSIEIDCGILTSQLIGFLAKTMQEYGDIPVRYVTSEDACKIFGDSHPVMGNHELEFSQRQFSFDTETKTLFTHGHQVFWSEEKINRWAKKKPGRGPIMRFLALFYSKWRMLKQPKIKDAHMDRAVELAKEFGAVTVVTGHRHPKERLYCSKDGVTLIVLPRGRNDIFL